MLGYDPYTGQTFLYPYSGGYTPYGYSPYGYSPYGYSPYGYRYPYYGNPYLGFGYPAAVFVNPGQLFGLGPIQQSMAHTRDSAHSKTPRRLPTPIPIRPTPITITPIRAWPTATIPAEMLRRTCPSRRSPTSRRREARRWNWAGS